MKELFQAIDTLLSEISFTNINSKTLFCDQQNPDYSTYIDKFFQNNSVCHAISNLDGSVSPSLGGYVNLTECVFSLRFDLSNFYIRSNVDYQAGHPGPQFWNTSVNALSTKKYLLDSYSWSNLISIKHYWNYLNTNSANWIYKQITPEKIYQVHFFSLKESNQRSWKYFLTGERFLELLKSNKNFFEFCHFEHFDWLAFKEHRIKSTSSVKRDIDHKTAVVIFVDSLDRRIFNLGYMKNLLPNLFKLRNHGVLFSGFTSSASWTYPVLSSIYSGINSAIDLRLWRNSWPLDIFNNLPLSHFPAKEVRQVLLRKKLHREYLSTDNFHPFSLTKNLSQSVNIYGFKNSMNHSWRHGMSSFYTTSMEKSGFNSLNSLNEATELISSSNLNKLVFIDLDHAHRHTIPKTNYPNHNGKLSFNDLEFLKSMVMPEQTLTGNIGSDKVSIYLRRYQEIDKSLGSIMNFFGDDASYLLFSDHGSSFLDHISTSSESFQQTHNNVSSSVSLNKVATPTLLYAGSCLNKSESVDELVSSQDLYDIISHIMTPDYCPKPITKNQLLSSRLPIYFGGSGRMKTLSSGYSYSRDKSITSIEMMTRFGLESSDVRYLNVSLSENIDEAFSNINLALTELN